MPTTINASTSAGLIQSADTSGILQLQTANSTAVTIDASQNTTVNNNLNVTSNLSVTGTTTLNSSTLRSDTVKVASGTLVDFTGIPSWVKRITVMLSGVSTNGTSNYLVQIGDSGGIENTGYTGSSSAFSTSTVGSLIYSGIGYLLYGTYVAAGTYSGAVVLTNLTGNTWIITGGIARDDSVYAIITFGTKSTSATLDRVRITTVNGTDTFDAGLINILYE